jgi:hypothetical protein
MNIINKHSGCTAIVLFRLGSRQLELVWCPGGAIIENHVHANIDGTMIFLAGELHGNIAGNYGKTGWYDFGRRFSVPHGTVHGAKITGRFCLFLNWEKWTGKPTSAAIDFTAI